MSYLFVFIDTYGIIFKGLISFLVAQEHDVESSNKSVINTSCAKHIMEQGQNTLREEILLLMLR